MIAEPINPAEPTNTILIHEFGFTEDQLRAIEIVNANMPGKKKYLFFTSTPKIINYQENPDPSAANSYQFNDFIFSNPQFNQKNTILIVNDYVKYFIFSVDKNGRVSITLDPKYNDYSDSPALVSAKEEIQRKIDEYNNLGNPN